ncbi:MAG TPA: hypothetical protein VFA72_23055 [Burkholderiales bacterium]|jgi:hypothetical protein|nr:hypothetical protein [Burkholderiales bacterium]
MKALVALALSLAVASCAQTASRDDSVAKDKADRAGAGSSAPGGRADGQPGSYGPAAQPKAD